MSRFLDPLEVRVLEDRDGGRLVFQTLAKFRYESDSLGRVVTVPPGFVTDFESIPRTLSGFAGPICPKTGLVHDWLYQSHELGDDHQAKCASDAIGHEAWLAEGLDRVYADQRLAAVDFYGGKAWRTGPERLHVEAP